MNWIYMVVQVDDNGDITNVASAGMWLPEQLEDRDAQEDPGTWSVIKFKLGDYEHID